MSGQPSKSTPDPDQAAVHRPDESSIALLADSGGDPHAHAERAASMPGLVEAIEAWRQRLANAGVACRAVALHSADPQWQLDFQDSMPELRARWQTLRTSVDGAHPFGVDKPAALSGGDLLMASAIQLPQGQLGVVGMAMAPPYNDRTVQLVMLSLGWLQLAFSATTLAQSQRASRLLELLGYVASQSQARAAAQEWINRTAAWARQEAPDLAASFTLVLFEVRGHLPRWWVAADTAWAEQASPAMQDAGEVAAQALVEMREVRPAHWWAQPVVGDDGDGVAVLVARLDTAGAPQLAEPVLTVLRASLGLAEPLLRRWRQADRPLWRHLLDAARDSWRKLWGPGYWVWKAAATGLALALAALLVWPVPDRVSAGTVIEGQVRQVVTAPFDGFISQVLVRPGQRVTRGQAMAKLDDRDLKLEQGRFRSERDQAAGKLRQAMADHDSSAVALAGAEVQQAEAQLALVESKLGRAGLTAPLDGLVITGDWVQQVGGPVEMGKEMFEIASGEGYRVVLHVPDRDIARVQVGQTGVLRLTGQPQTAHTFRISNVTATASVQDSVNGFRVEAEWQGTVPVLSPGMQGIGKIEVGEANLLTLWTRSSVDWLRLKLWSWWW